MHTIDLSDQQCTCYERCSLEQHLGGGFIVHDTVENRLRIMRNLIAHVESIPEENREMSELAIIGPLPPWVFKIVFSMTVSFFMNWSYRDRAGNYIPLPITSNPS